MARATDEVAVKLSLLRAKQFSSDANRSSKAIGGIGKSAKKTAADVKVANAAFGKMRSGASLLTRSLTGGLLLGLGAVSAEVVRATKGWSEHQAVVRQTNLTIKSMGNVAGVSARHVGKLSDSVEAITGIDGDQIQKSANVLLTFGKVRGKVFDDAIKASANLSRTEFFKGDPIGAAKTLGKALQDPVKGAAALKKGGTLGAQDIETLTKMAKAGKSVAQQQRYILDAITKQAPLIKATPWESFQTTLRGLEDDIGRVFLPLFNQGISTLNRLGKQIQPAFDAVSHDLNRIFKRKDMDFGQKIATSMQSIKRHLGPFADSLLQGLKDAHIDQKLAAGVRWAEPQVASAFFAAGKVGLSALWNGFKGGDAKVKGGTVITAAWVLSRFGLGSAFGKAGGSLFRILTGGFSRGKGGGVLSSVKPVPVIVVNKGFGGGRGPGGGGPLPVPGASKLKTAAKFALTRFGPAAAAYVLAGGDIPGLGRIYKDPKKPTDMTGAELNKKIADRKSQIERFKGTATPATMSKLVGGLHKLEALRNTKLINANTKAYASTAPLQIDLSKALSGVSFHLTVPVTTKLDSKTVYKTIEQRRVDHVARTLGRQP